MNSRFRPLMLLSTTAGLVAIVATIASALTVAAISLDQLTNDSDLIVHGTVLSSHSTWEDQSIYTYTTIRVTETLKGPSETEIVVKQLGGAVGDTRAEIDGSPVLNPGDELVLFLRDWQESYWIHSIVLGKFSVLRENGVPMAVSDLNNVGLVDPATGLEITDPTVKRNAIELSAFFSAIRSFDQQ
ncbi:MAG: hypothetical protein OEV30_00520 [Ignavibacteria bacterium]|nr:hypothetical protein [Ignavibacteria bacterium]